MELFDTSVWIQHRNPALRQWFEAALASGSVAMCDIIAMELLVGEPNAERCRLRAAALASLIWIPPDGRDWVRARQVQAELADSGRQLHQRVKIPDLIIAACAERAGIELIHYDQDYDAIQQVTGQAARWAAPRGSL